MSSRPAPMPSQSPVHWVSGANVFYLRLLSVPAQECHGVTFTLFNRESRDGVSGLFSGAVSATHVIWRRMVWGKRP